eukprot:TRINITY_DN12667_c0_g2_i1.p1 TRINITY_DN12667_c0_g2~~TRINITY_DN12667_c0_g2_i1.p1  ORF type:complete len:794 (-),score=61.99 TRINITY_DN12667_c0_g2_i1:622-3003(-)
MPPRSTFGKSVALLAENLIAAHENEVKALWQRVHYLEQSIARNGSDDAPLVPLDSHNIPSPSVPFHFASESCDSHFASERCDDLRSPSDSPAQTVDCMDTPSVRFNVAHQDCDEFWIPDEPRTLTKGCMRTALLSDLCARNGTAHTFTAVDNWRRVTKCMLELGRQAGSYTLRNEFSEDGQRRLSIRSKNTLSSKNTVTGDAVLDVLAHRSNGLLSKPSFNVDEFAELNDPHGCCLWRFMSHLMIYPYSNVRLAWVLSGFGILLFDLVDLSLEAFRLVESEARIDALRWVVLSFWCLDVIVSFLTGVAVNERLEMRPKRVAVSYLRGWFTFDVLVLLPDIMEVVLHDLTSAFGILKHLKIFRYLRLLRMVRLAKLRYLLKTLDAKINSIVLLLSIRMCGATCCLVAWIHVSACVWYMAGSADDSGWVNVEAVNELSLLHRYLFSVQWAAAQFQGSTSIGTSKSMICLAAATSIIILSVIFMATFFSRLTSIMHELLQLHNSRVQTMTKVKALITAHKISPQLSFMVQRFADLSMRVGESRTFGVRDQVLNLLPVHLREQLTVEMLYPEVAKHTFVMAVRLESEVMFKKIMCKAMSEHIYHHAESIFSSGEVATRVYMSVAGSLSYRPAAFTIFRKYGHEFMKGMAPLKCPTHSDDVLSIEVLTRKSMRTRSEREGPAVRGAAKRTTKVRTRVIPEGSLLSEAGVWVAWCHEGDLETVTEASMLHLNLFRFRELLEKFPGVTARLQLNAERFLSALNDPDQDAKDLLHSSEIIKKLGCLEKLPAIKRVETKLFV